MLTRFRDNEFICVWSIWNALFLGFLGVSTVLGYTQSIFAADRSYISYLIAAIFFAGWGYSLKRAIQVHRMGKTFPSLAKEYFHMVLSQRTEGDAREALGIRFSNLLTTIDFIPLILVSLGLVGTVLGFMIGMGEIKPEMIGNAQAAGQSLTLMLKGLAIGFITTLTGVAGAIWIQFQKHMITVQLTSIYERILSGETK